MTGYERRNREARRVGWGISLAAFVIFLIANTSVTTWPPRIVLFVAYLALMALCGWLEGIAKSAGSDR